MSREATARQMVEQGIGRVKIAEATGLTKHRIQKIQAEVKAQALASLPVSVEGRPYVVEPVVSTPPKRSYYADAFTQFKELIGKEGEVFLPCRRPSNERWAVFSDVHLPFHDPDMLVKACDRAEAEGCGGLILAGDTFDLYSISRYTKEKKIHLQDELAKARLAFEYLASRFPQVRIFWGNHEKGRWDRFLSEFVHEQFHYLIPDFKQVLVGGLPNVEMVGHTTTWGKEMLWLYQLGEDCILTHSERSKSVQGAQLEDLRKWLRNWGRRLGLNPTPRVLTTGHTHNLTCLDKDDAVLMETGMLASFEAQEYQIEPGAGKGEPGVYGFVIIQQENGVSKLSECRTVRLND